MKNLTLLLTFYISLKGKDMYMFRETLSGSDKMLTLWIWWVVCVHCIGLPGFLSVWKLKRKEEINLIFISFWIMCLLSVSDFKSFSLSLEFCSITIIYSVWFSFYLFWFLFIPFWILIWDLLILENSQLFTSSNIDSHPFFLVYSPAILIRLDLFTLPLMSHIFCVYLCYIVTAFKDLSHSTWLCCSNLLFNSNISFKELFKIMYNTHQKKCADHKCTISRIFTV